MPKNLNAPILSHPYVDRNGEWPLTRILDMEEWLKVRMIEWPDEHKVGPALAEYVESSFLTRPPEGPQGLGDQHLSDVVEGKALWQSMETLHFRFQIAYCTRVFTHQLVRHRIGVTFAQHCYGDHDARHADIILARCFGNEQREEIIQQTLNTKMLYTQLLDSGFPMQEVRYIVPHTSSTFIYVYGSLKALAEMYKVRSCTMTQIWEMLVFIERMKKAILEVAPWAEPVFQCPCDKGQCFYHMGREGGKVNHYWAPDEKHDTFDWHPNTFQHGEKIHAEMSSGPAFATRYFCGREEIDDVKWQQYAGKYSA